MKNKKIGVVLRGKDGRPFIKLGSTNNRNEKYNYSVEITVKDNNGQVISKQSDGFLNLIDPRKEPARLLEANVITEDRAAEMEERVANLSDKLIFELMMKCSDVE
jgi:hypothetical protein